MSDDFVAATRSPPVTSPLIALVTREVRVRFVLSREAFAARLEALVSGATQPADRSLVERAARLCLDDLYLATACLYKDEQAWRELGSAHFDFMRQFARRFLPETGARDVVDAVIADLWTRGRLGQYEGRSALRTWLATVVTHAALNSRKAMTRLVPLDHDQMRAHLESRESREPVDPCSEQTTGLLHDILVNALNGLPDEDRVMLRLYYEQGLTLEEMGAVLGASAAAISRRLKRTREALRADVETCARRRTGESADVLRTGVDWGDLDLDLGKVLGCTPQASGKEDSVV